MRNIQISSSDDIIDSRDIIARIEELQDLRADLESTSEDAAENLKTNEGNKDADIGELEEALETAKQVLKDWDEDEEGRELKSLLDLADECEGYVDDWKYGAALIRESYFTEYAEQLAEDIGDYNSRDVKWPYTCIDWEKAADELKADYTTVDFDGVIYFVR